MNDAKSEPQADEKRLEDLFNKSSMLHKLIIKALAGLKIMMDSNLDRSVKFDAIKATVEMIVSGSELHALTSLRHCNEDTQVPLEVVHPMMTLRAIDEFYKSELRFNTIMQLFVDEAEKRRNG